MSDDFLLPRESSRLVMSLARDVSIDPEAVERLADMLQKTVKPEEFDLRKWKSDNSLHPQTMTPDTIDLIFVTDSLNFSFWPDPGMEYSIDGQTGYWALCAALQRALRENVPVTDARWQSQLTLDEARKIFRTDNGSVEIPMLAERVSILNAQGAILLENFDGTFVNCVRQCNGSAIRLLRMIYQWFPSFRDEAIYDRHRVTFLKRAQILIADIWGCFEGQGEFGTFHDIDQLTMFADYRVPQVLHYFDVLRYSNRLETELRKKSLLRNGDPYEVELRAASIDSIEMIRELLKKKNPSFIPNSIQLDFYLWGYRRQHHEEIDRKSPFHRVRCIYY